MKKTALDRLEEKEKAARTLKPIVERRPQRKYTPAQGGKPKCDVCGKHIRGKQADHEAGEHHQRALKEVRVKY